MENIRLTPKEIRLTVEGVPTPDEWKQKPSQLYWERQHLLEAQLAKLRDMAPAEVRGLRRGIHFKLRHYQWHMKQWLCCFGLHERTGQQLQTYCSRCNKWIG